MTSEQNKSSRSAKPFRQSALYGTPRYLSDLSRVQTMDSSMASLPNDQNSSSGSNSDDKSEKDPDEGAVKPWRHQDQEDSDPEQPSPVYPERKALPHQPVQQVGQQVFNTQTVTVQSQQYRGPPVPMNRNEYGGANEYQYGRQQTYRNQYGQPPPPVYPKSGHKYGMINIKGNARVIQGNAYDPCFPVMMESNHEFEGINVDGNASLIMSDVPINVLPTFWGMNDGMHLMNEQQREQIRRRREQQQQQQQQPTGSPQGQLLES